LTAGDKAEGPAIDHFAPDECVTIEQKFLWITRIGTTPLNPNQTTHQAFHQYISIVN
jgi:hypothetical protein